MSQALCLEGARGAEVGRPRPGLAQGRCRKPALGAVRTECRGPAPLPPQSSLGVPVLSRPQGKRSGSLKGQAAALSVVEDALPSDQRLRCALASVPGLFRGCFTPEGAECPSVFFRAIACPPEMRGLPSGGLAAG